MNPSHKASTPNDAPPEFSGVSLPDGDAEVRILAAINEIHLRHHNNHEGELPTYIPELANADPNEFAISVVTTSGHAYNVGSVDRRFTLQSIANPFVYGLVLDLLGRERVLQSVGVEPTGNPFSAIVLDRKTNRPMNPMVNAGAIAIASMIPGATPTDRLNRLLALFACLLDEKPIVNMQVFISEKSTGDRNRSIAYLMRNFKMLEANIDETLDLYFQQCSVSVTAPQLALMAATLANGGVQPQSGREVFSHSSVRDVLTIMLTCGLYESSGTWVHRVGIPAKSGVGGGFMAVVPGRMGIAVYSPKLDQHGTSVRGQRACEDLAALLNLHLFGNIEARQCADV